MLVYKLADSCCDGTANSTGMVGYDFGAQSAFVSVGADTEVSGKEVQARCAASRMSPWPTELPACTLTAETEGVPTTTQEACTLSLR